MVEDQVDAWARRDRCQAFQEFVRGKDQVARAVMPRARERAEHATVGEARQPFLRERWAQKVADEALEPGTVVGADGTIGVEIETLEVRVARADRPDPRGIGRAADAQDRCAGAVPEGRPSTDGGGADVGEDGGVGGEGIGLEVGRIVGGENTPTSEQAEDAGADRREQTRHLTIGRWGRGIETGGGAVRCGRKHTFEEQGMKVDVELDAPAEPLKSR